MMWCGNTLHAIVSAIFPAGIESPAPVAVLCGKISGNSGLLQVQSRLVRRIRQDEGHGKSRTSSSDFEGVKGAEPFVFRECLLSMLCMQGETREPKKDMIYIDSEGNQKHVKDAAAQLV